MINLNTLYHIRKRKNLLCGHGTAGIDQLLHQLIIWDAEIAPASQSGTGIHNKSNQDPSGRVKDLINRKICRIYFINSFHHIVKLWKLLFATIILINNTCTGWGNTALSLILSCKLLSLMLTGVVIKPKSTALYIRNICKTIILCDLNQSILQILWMGKFPVIDNSCLF